MGQTDLLDKESLLAGAKKRYREATPPEVLSEEDEEKFCRLEKEASQKRDNEDPDWESETESTRKKRRVKPDWEGETEREGETESTSDWKGKTESTSD